MNLGLVICFGLTFLKISSSSLEQDIEETLKRKLKKLIDLDKLYLGPDLNDVSSDPDIKNMMGTKEGQRPSVSEADHKCKCAHGHVQLQSQNNSLKITRSFHHRTGSSTVPNSSLNDQSINSTFPKGTTLVLPPTPTPTTYKDSSVVYEFEPVSDVTEIKMTDFNSSRNVINFCPHYKNTVPELDLHDMEGVWQVMYYKGEKTVGCFEVFMEKISPEVRRYYAEKFSSYNISNVNWRELYMEVDITKPAPTRHGTNKHFLQRVAGHKGVLNNVMLLLIFPEPDSSYEVFKSPDQWMVTKNLLLHRDCLTGDVEVLRRTTGNPSIDEIEEAMRTFGEHGLSGTFKCVPREHLNEMEIIRQGGLVIEPPPLTPAAP